MGAAFYIAVEDDLSDAVLRRLLQHVRREFEVRARYPLPALPHMKPQPAGYGYLRTNVQAFNKASAETPHLLLTDLDVALCAPDGSGVARRIAAPELPGASGSPRSRSLAIG